MRKPPDRRNVANWGRLLEGGGHGAVVGDVELDEPSADLVGGGPAAGVVPGLGTQKLTDPLAPWRQEASSRSPATGYA